MHKIRNPEISLLSKYVIAALNPYGKLKPLTFGKLKGFRIEYNKDVNRLLIRDTIFDVLSKYGIRVISYTEQFIGDTGHINIHEITAEDSDIIGRVDDEEGEFPVGFKTFDELKNVYIDGRK